MASLTMLLAVLVTMMMIMPVIHSEDPYVFLTWNVNYKTLAPVGVPQRVITINDQFPGPQINCTSNNNIVINVFNNLDEPLLFTWNGMQHRKNSWQDGMPGTNCPILPGTNFTYHYQPKDQIGSYFYFPSTGMQRVAGGYGSIRVNSRPLIPVPLDTPADDFSVLLGDWYSKDHAALAKQLDAGHTIARPDGFVINGKTGKDKTGKVDDEPMFTFESGKVYRFRICNVGIRTSLGFRIQGHIMTLVEMDGSHVVQNKYEYLDLHSGQCYSVLVTADQKPGDYYMVASTRFMKDVQTATAVIRYAGSKAPPPTTIPTAPAGWAWSLNQWRSFRWNLTASAARPNPQGSYHYGQINITRTIKLVNSRSQVNGKLHYALNGVSHTDSPTPLKLAEYYNIADKVFKYNIMGDVPPTGNKVTLAPNVIKVEHRTFVEIVFENPEKVIQSYHVDGYSFFPVGMGPGKWSESSRKTYNMLDAVSRHSIHVYPKSWTAILLTFDNAGMWNIRSNMWERFYLGQQLYASVLSPARSLRDEYNMPDSILRCGEVANLPLPEPYNS